MFSKLSFLLIALLIASASSVKLFKSGASKAPASAPKSAGPAASIKTTTQKVFVPEGESVVSSDLYRLIESKFEGIDPAF